MGIIRSDGISIIDSIIPFRYFDWSTVEGRKAYVENFQHRLGRLLGFLPFILIMTIGCHEQTAAIWSAFGVGVFVMVFNYYYSTFDPNTRDPVLILEAGMTVSFLAQGITNAVVSFECHLISPINTTTLFAVAILSMVVCYPFTIQFAKAKVSPEVAKTSEFVQFNQVLTAIWVAIFMLMAISGWLGYVYFRDDSSSAGYIVLVTVIPIVLPLLGSFGMPFLVEYLKNKASANATSGSYGEGLTE